MEGPKPIYEHLLKGQGSKTAANILDDLRAVAFHLSNLLETLHVPKNNDLDCSRVAQAIMDATNSRIDPLTVLDIVEQEETCREVERLPSKRRRLRLQ